MPLIKAEEACPLTEYVVRATLFEQHCLWCHYAAASAERPAGLRGVSWNPEEPGWTTPITLDGEMTVLVLWVRVEGRLVAFVEPWSRKTDLDVLEAWIKTTFPATRKVLNAENFSQIYTEVMRNGAVF